MGDQEAVEALITDLHWQVDQIKPRGIKNTAGHPYNPSHYKRGLDDAIERGGLEVVEYVRGYVHKPPSGGYKKLEEANALDLACEMLVTDESRPYAALFTDEDRAAARERLGSHVKAFKDRHDADRARVIAKRNELRAGRGQPPLTEAQLSR